MDYSQYKKLEFRRKFIAIPPKIKITDPLSGKLVGFIKMKLWSLRGDVRVYTDETMQNEIVRIGGRQVISFRKVFNVYDSTNNTPMISIQQNSLKSVFVRNHMDIIDGQGKQYGYIQETSSGLAIFRRWVEMIPAIGGLIGMILLFVPQKFDIMYDPAGSTPQLAGKVVHKKNPLIVKMSLDTTAAQVALDPRICIAAVSLLSILDAAKSIDRATMALTHSRVIIQALSIMQNRAYTYSIIYRRII